MLHFNVNEIKKTPAVARLTCAWSRCALPWRDESAGVGVGGWFDLRIFTIVVPLEFCGDLFKFLGEFIPVSNCESS